MIHLISLLIGFIADLLFGDIRGFPHIVVGMGKLINALERIIRRIFPKTRGYELLGGAVLAFILCAVSYLSAWGLMYLCRLAHPALAVIAGSFLCWQCIGLRDLKDESMSVYRALKTGDIPAARRAVGMIVGRDTDALDERGITRAAVETVAENSSDGVMAPLIFIALGGAPFGVLYKAINTMDSMLGYRNSEYLYFGRAAARLDDLVNLLPSRISALFMIAAARFAGLDMKNARRIFRRDRYNHKSPNSGQTEAACAGALHVRLGGDSQYFGALVHKPTIGDDDRPAEPEDIPRANRLVFLASCSCLIICALVRTLVLLL